MVNVILLPCLQRSEFAAVLVFYNVQPGAAAD